MIIGLDKLGVVGTLRDVSFLRSGLSIISSSLIFLIPGSGFSANVIGVLSESGRVSIAIFSVGCI